MYFKTPNVWIVFQSSEPKQNTLSKDKLIILTISNDLTGLSNITRGNVGVKKGKSVGSEWQWLRFSNRWEYVANGSVKMGIRINMRLTTCRLIAYKCVVNSAL